MVNDSFGALANPVRRRIVERLTTGPLTVGAATRGLVLSKPAISRHVRVLEDAGVVVRTVQGRTHLLALNVAALDEASGWLDQQRSVWERLFRRRGGSAAHRPIADRTVNAPGERTLRIERVFAAPITETFDAWTTVDVLQMWWPAGPGWDTPVAEVDMRVGGRLRLVMRNPDGAQFGGGGRYVTIERPHRLAFTWGWDTTVLGTHEQLIEITFTDNGDGTTTVVLTNSGLTEADEQSHRDGWTASFDNLDAVLAAEQS